MQADDFQELQQIALRMRREMPLKERTIHLQTFRWTFHGQQAVSFLVTAGISPDAQAAAELCQQLMQHGLCKSVYHKEHFTPDSEVYRFSSSMLDNKHKGLTSLTSTGLYKEIAKFGKAAAQPFKSVQVSLNDTLATLGSLSAVAPKLGSSSNNSSNAHTANGSHPGHSMSSRLAKLPTRRSLTGKRETLAGSSSSPAESLQDSLAGVIAELQAVQAAYKESSSLMRLDLQQHTALQEHMVGLLMAQQTHNQRMQVLAAVIAAAASLLLVVSSAAAGGWPVQLLGGLLLGFVLLQGLPGSFSLPAGVRAQQGIAAGILGRAAGAPATSALDSCHPLSQTTRSGPPLDTLSAQLSVVAEAGSRATSTVTDEESGSDMVEGDWEECGPCLDDFDDWPDAPCMLCPDPAVAKQVFAADSCGPCQALPLNSAPIPFESELFSGVVVVYVRHLPTTPSQLFKGKKRLIWVALQGTFKRPVSMDSLVFGQEFSHKLCNLPAPWFIDNMLLPLARKISPALRVGNLEQPYLYSPLITASQVVNVSPPDAVPPLMEAKEDISLLAASLGRQPGDLGTVHARRKHFQSAAHRSAASFGPGHVWTFHMWQEYVDYASYMLNLSYSSYDLTQHLDGQPLQVMVKDVSSSTYLVNLQVWHSNLVRSSQRHFTRQPTRPRAARDRSTQVTAGGVAPDQESATPSYTQQDPRLSDASTADMGQQQLLLLLDEQQQQSQGQQSSRVSTSGDALLEEASSPHSEHWFDARYSQSQQDMPPENEQQQQQQELGQLQQQQQHGLPQQPTVAHALPEQQQLPHVLQLQQVWQRMQSGTSMSSPISPVSASGSSHAASMARAAAAGAAGAGFGWGQGPGLTEDHDGDVMRSGVSASAVAVGDTTPEGSGPLKSMRSL